MVMANFYRAEVSTFEARPFLVARSLGTKWLPGGGGGGGGSR